MPAHLDVAALLDGVSAKERIQHWVNGLLNVLEQHDISGLYGTLDRLQVTLHSQADHLWDGQIDCRAGYITLENKRNLLLII